MSLRVRFWGVRGSIAAPGPGTVEFGGNTSCVEVRCGDELLIFDGGTGLRGLGTALLARGQPVRASLFFSHVHWDHIQGFPFFAPIYVPGTELTLYGSPEGISLGEVLALQMGSPTFPVSMRQLGAHLTYRRAPERRAIRVGDALVRAARLNHPNGVLAYRLEWNGTSLVYATDTEHRAEVDRALVALARGADLLIYDAMFTEEELTARRGWGHSTYNEGIRVAREAGVGKLVLFHHDPAHSDAELRRIEHAAAEELPGTVAAREGMVLEVPPRGVRSLAA